MTAAADTVTRPKTSSRFLRRALPYLLSLPALLVCIGILIPFFTAVYYSLLRFRLNLPALKGFIWFDNYINFLTDAAFWNTVKISLVYAGLTVGVELLLGLGIALLLQKPSRFNNIASILLLLPLMILTGIAQSPGFTAAMPWLLDLFGGRQSARTLHTIGTVALVLFVAVHLFEIAIAGFFTKVRSMIIGK